MPVQQYHLQMFTASTSHLSLLLGHSYNTDVSNLMAYPVIKKDKLWDDNDKRWCFAEILMPNLGKMLLPDFDM